MNDKNEFEPRLSEFKYSIIMALVGLVFGGFSGYYSPEPNSILSGIAFGILFGGFFFITTEHAKYLFFEKYKENAKILKKIEDRLSERTDKVITHAALFTTNDTFEDAMRPLYNERLGKTKWIIAKFISQKLSKHFEDRVKLKIEGVMPSEYSELVERMIPECEDHIFLTNPYTPTDWFDELKPLLGEKRANIRDGKELSIEDFKGHVRALLSSPPQDKRRLNILSKDTYQRYVDVCKTNISYFNDLKEFVRIEKITMKGKFVLVEDLMDYYKNSTYSVNECDFLNTDYGIFDKKVLLEYNKVERNLYLHFPPPPLLLEIFNFESIDIYKPTEDIVNEINEK